MRVAERVAACGADLLKGVYHCQLVLKSIPVEQSVQMRLYLGRCCTPTSKPRVEASRRDANAHRSRWLDVWITPSECASSLV